MNSLKKIKVSPSAIKEIIEEVLAKAGKLSDEPSETWHIDRPHRAADNLFQVVINPDKATYAVDSLSGVFKVPSQDSTLYNVLVTRVHELEHVNQAFVDDSVGKTVKLARLKGKRVSGLREAGANAVQRSAEKTLFGLDRAYAGTYAKALESLESGGFLLGATRAFYEEKIKVSPDMDRMSSAIMAADRVLRLVRGGGIDSRPMVYAEESLLANELKDLPVEFQRRAGAVTGLDLVDQMRLHRFGLLDVPRGGTVEWMPILLDVLRSRYPEKFIVNGSGTM